MADPPAVKICGLTRRADVLAAAEAGADYVGVVLSEGFARSVDPAAAAALTEGVRSARVAVLVDETADSAHARGEALGADVLQLHGAEDEGVVERLRGLGPWRIWKAVRARGSEELEVALLRWEGRVEGIVVEGWKEGVVGGGGARLGEGLVRGLRARVPERLTLVLAGGLTPESVAAAARASGADVVDVSSGVEVRPGRKDAKLIGDFVRAARGDAGPPPRRGPRE